MVFSHSSLSLFESCPRRFYVEKVLGDTIPLPPSPEIQYGLDVHKGMEVAIASGKAPEGSAAAYSDWLDILPSGEKYAEVSLAVGCNFEPVEWDDEAAIFRGVVDVLIFHKDAVYIYDFKTGKRRFGFAQIDAYVALTSSRYAPENIQGGYIWLKDSMVDLKEYDKEDMEACKAALTLRIKTVQSALDDQDFDWYPQPSGLCRFCPVFACEFNRASAPGR